ncbi:myb family transcription factor [Dorcoceras hygrometricum]|uniref:Myb family transcription factor n=1 Tax=Dorcoceras hygrometricum TaxID=472368 RepID=A0A2Z7C116_9LAMI|nr:myb family transcription factor [Dorcoceras hygrometricum]
MRELRVTSCGFGKTVEEVERRRFVKMKLCVLEQAARGFLAIARRCRLKKSIRQRFAFALKIQQMACAMIKPAGSHSYLESAGTLLKDNQQILSQSSVQATNQQVRDLGRIRAIELLPDFIQTAGFVLPDFTPYSCYQTSGFAQFT